MASKKALTAVEACKELGKALRSELNKSEKVKVAPKDAALKVTKAVIKEIKEFQKNLEKMDAMEKAVIDNKFDFSPDEKRAVRLDRRGRGTTPKGINLPTDNPFVGDGKSHTIKERLGISDKGRMVREKDTHLLGDRYAAGAIARQHGSLMADAAKIKPKLTKEEEKMEKDVLPSVKSKRNVPKEMFGKIKKDIPSDAPLSNEPPVSNESLKLAMRKAPKKQVKSVFSVLGKTTIPEAVAAKDKVEPTNKNDKKESNKDAVLPDFKAPVDVSGKDQGSGGELAKAFGDKKPFLGGKDDASKQMSAHANMDAAKAAKNAKMPTRQQSTKVPGAQAPAAGMPAMPSPAAHAKRANVFAAFMPKVTKLKLSEKSMDKDSLKKDMEHMDKFCKSKEPKAVKS